MLKRPTISYEIPILFFGTDQESQEIVGLFTNLPMRMPWTSATLTSCTVAAVFSTSCLAATPAAVPTYMNIDSIRVLEYATAEADRQTGTSRLAPWPRFGTIAEYGTL